MVEPRQTDGPGAKLEIEIVLPVVWRWHLGRQSRDQHAA
jgi:hypothetical protein